MHRFTSPARRHNQILAIAVLLTTSALVSLSRCGYHFSANSDDSTYSKVAPAVWETIARARLNHLQSRFKQEDTLSEMGLKIGNPAWDEYVNELQGVYQEFFKPEGTESAEGELINTTSDNTLTATGTWAVRRVQDRLAESFNDLSTHTEHPEYQQLSEYIPHTIHATSKEPIFPPQFSTWDRLNSKDGWEVKHWDDNGIWQWMNEVFGQEKTTGGGMSGQTEGAQILKVYKQLPSGVLRGLYTDTDTACVRPIRQWPGIRENHWDLMWKTDPLLASLPHMHDLLSVATSSDRRGNIRNGTHDVSRDRELDAIQSWIKDSERNSWEPPKLIVAVEFDYWGPRAAETWTEIGYSRGFQIVQWTMLAQPGHPVFLDVLGRIIRDVKKHRAVQADYAQGQFNEEISKNTLLDVLDFTGPGVFSDAVFRYLLARWGAHPRDISGASAPIRIDGAARTHPSDMIALFPNMSSLDIDRVLDHSEPSSQLKPNYQGGSLSPVEGLGVRVLSS
ncbi:hypothetical protein QFC19_000692 [Naganishia cerealis]|uniref:Uncharacterized protein n=1 Tax=Naganishia cerealis TaxID=610337 RepID=A0ACC2WLD1_9TREE|nr:hypothetical protein QFC19_000692 [Naganishia cerealis]